MPEFPETAVLDHPGEISIGLGAIVVLDGNELTREVGAVPTPELAITLRSCQNSCGPFHRIEVSHFAGDSRWIKYGREYATLTIGLSNMIGHVAWM
jgi:hypothetical protein